MISFAYQRPTVASTVIAIGALRLGAGHLDGHVVR